METKRMILCERDTYKGGENGNKKDEYTYEGGEECPLETLALRILHLQPKKFRQELSLARNVNIVSESDLWNKVSHPVENIHPALQSDTLERCEHCQHKVVKVGYPKIWTLSKKIN